MMFSLWSKVYSTKRGKAASRSAPNPKKNLRFPPCIHRINYVRVTVLGRWFQAALLWIITPSQIR